MGFHLTGLPRFQNLGVCSCPPIIKAAGFRLSPGSAVISLYPPVVTKATAAQSNPINISCVTARFDGDAPTQSLRLDRAGIDLPSGVVDVTPIAQETHTPDMRWREVPHNLSVLLPSRHAESL
jgi:hypothetical protein